MPHVMFEIRRYNFLNRKLIQIIPNRHSNKLEMALVFVGE